MCGGDIKYNSFEPKNHEEPPGKGAVSYAFTITASLDEELSDGLFVLLLQLVQWHGPCMAGWRGSTDCRRGRFCSGAARVWASVAPRLPGQSRRPARLRFSSSAPHQAS
ncbi:hypothetical protein PAL_GLEAN10008464 [Pteropus alecto]|uniref:Uncharacterized protein n=1 Tax=Pteropus alecto TaxID=9402 RepID=L5KHY8_PTEAL|nr:hypothetical protein PAL_GLEAN10008464 [Pteropus alecto]